jgi:hypothetical protein
VQGAPGLRVVNEVRQYSSRWEPLHGMTGEFRVAASDKRGRDLRAHGRLCYGGKHYLQFAGTKQYFLKAGADAPETLLAYADAIVGNPEHSNTAYCFAEDGQLYLIYLPAGGHCQLNLQGVTGQFEVAWFDPRSGGPLQSGSVAGKPVRLRLMRRDCELYSLRFRQWFHSRGSAGVSGALHADASSSHWACCSHSGRTTATNPPPDASATSNASRSLTSISWRRISLG